jgi:histidinol-phosphatase (PHP family)
MIDYHVHTKLCKHAYGEVDAYIETAIALGITELAFTDHIPLPGNFDIAHRMQQSEMDTYCKWIADAKKRYPEIKIRLGVEADYYEGFESFLSNFLQNYDLDLVIMSIHFIKDWPDGNWIFNYDLPQKTQNNIYEDYLAILTKGVQTDLFDILGHVDIIKKPGDSLIQSVPDKVEQLLLEVEKHKMAIEINTSGFRKQIFEPYPGFDWFPTIKRLGIPITIGSDAHSPEQVGLRFQTVYSQIEQHGINKVVTFDGRQKSNYTPIVEMDHTKIRK